MNLYRIDVEHVGPKDSHKSIECFLLANNDEDVYKYLDEKLFGLWSGRHKDQQEEPDPEDRFLNIENEYYEVIGRETYKQLYMRVKGELNDKDRSYDDAFYGITFYGWHLLQSGVNNDQIKNITNLGIEIKNPLDITA